MQTPRVAAEPGWQAAAPYPSNIAYYGFAQNGDDLYIISGRAMNGNYPDDLVPVTDVRRYNVKTDTWTSLADIPLGSYWPPSVYYEGKIYVLDSGGAADDGPQTFMRIYDGASDTWSVGAPRPPAYPAETYPNNRNAAAVAFNGNIYIVGRGFIFVYNIAGNTWSVSRADLAFGSSHAQIGQYIYQFGGIRWGSYAGIFNSDFCQRFDMATQVWSSGPKWTFRRHSFALAAIGNKLFAIGGDEDGFYDNAGAGVAELDTSRWPDGAWVRSPYKLPSARMKYGAGFVSNGRTGGEIWSTGGDPIVNPPLALNEHLFLPVSVTEGASSIVSAGSNGIIDRGETVTVRLGVEKTIGTATCTPNALTGTLQTSGGVVNPSVPQNYGTVCLGNPVFRDFTFTVDSNLPCGAEITASLVLTNGTDNYGTFRYRFNVGRLAVLFAEDFDNVAAPALPPGWVTSHGLDPSWYGSPPLWITSTAIPDTGVNEAFVEDTTYSTNDRRLDSPPIPVNSSSAIVRFRHVYIFNPYEENTWNYDYDLNGGGVLELSSPNIYGGKFIDITDPAVGGSFIAGEYDALLDDCCSGLSGREAWGRTSAGYVTTVAKLGQKVKGQVIKLRFRVAADYEKSPGGGWRIDSIVVGTPICEGNAPEVSRAVSRKSHGTSGTFDIDLPLLPLESAIGIENRIGTIPGEHQIVVTFAKPVTIGFASVISGAGSVASTTVSGEVVTINLAGVTDAQRLGVALSSVSDGVNLGNVMIPLGVLWGDTNGNGSVNSSDIGQIKSQSGQPVTASNIRADIDGNGAINSKDISAAKLRTGTALP